MIKGLRPTADQSDDLYAPHLAGLLCDQFLVQRWDSTENLQWPPQIMNGSDQSTAHSWVAVNLRGTVYSYSISRRAFHPWFVDRSPYGIVIVDVPEGVRLLGNWFDDPDLLECGQEVAGTLVHGEQNSVTLEWRPITD